MSSDKSALVALTEDQIDLLLWLCQKMLEPAAEYSWLGVPHLKANLAGVIGQLSIASYALKQEEHG